MSETDCRTPPNDEVVEAPTADPYDAFLCEWWEDSQKRNLPLLNEILRSLLTLATALSGSALLLLQQAEPGLRIAAALSFLAAAGVALYGALPFAGKAHPYLPDEIAAHKSHAQLIKLTCAQAAGGLIAIGLGLLMLAVFTLANAPAPR